MRALLAVSEKTGIIGFGRRLSELGWELTSTTGTAQSLADAGIAVTRIADLIGVPEMLGGRVKTFHPRLFGGVLYCRGDASHEADVISNNIIPIDLVACNFYPLHTIANVAAARLVDVQNQIDIGGPALIRGAAKNFQWVIPVVNPDDYASVLAMLTASKGEPSGVDQKTRWALAMKAFRYTARYDSEIIEYLSNWSQE